VPPRSEGGAAPATGQDEQDGVGQELDGEVAFGGAQSAAQSDLGAAFEGGSP
jgi:hypothetical protein